MTTVVRTIDPLSLPGDATETTRTDLPIGRRSDWRCEPPTVAFGVARTVFALPVFLINGFRVDLRSRLARVLEVCINVVNMHDESSARLRQRAG